MSSQPLSEFLGKGSIHTLLAQLAENETGVTRAQLDDFMRDAAVEDQDGVFNALLSRGLLSQFAGRYALNAPGRRAHLLVAGINGMSNEEVILQLRRLYPDLFPYELVREGMTNDFIDSLHSRPDFRRIYICSPWVILDTKARRRLSEAVYAANELGAKYGYSVEVFCICHAPEGSDERRTNMQGTMSFLKDTLQAEIITHYRLHSKLYIREQGTGGGMQLAIVGSQNMTGSNHLELGIKITNDSLMIGRLTSYFMNIRAMGEQY
jgi:hypothetical protein